MNPGAREQDNDAEFCLFKKQLYHSSIAAVFKSMKDSMQKPVVRQCPDGHFHRTIFGFGPFIVDYPEQVVLAGIIQGWCCR